MALSAFHDPARPPTEADLAAILGPAMPLWTALVADIVRHAGDLVESWHHGGAKFGWSMRLVRKDRNLVHLTPQAGAFLVGVALGERAIATAEAAGIASARTLAIMAAAPKYAEGRGLRYPVASDDDLAVAKELARIKLAPVGLPGAAVSAATPRRAPPRRRPRSRSSTGASGVEASSAAHH